MSEYFEAELKHLTEALEALKGTHAPSHLAGDFIPHDGSPHVVDDSDEAQGHSRVGADSNTQVEHPDHYTAGKVECIDAIEAAVTGLNGFEGYLTGNALKYLWRHDRKGGTQDLEKAKIYINWIIESRKERGAK